jgi:sec-independent protein translocase protein TatA
VPNIGPLELVVVLIIALLVLGPQRLPQVARSVGRGVREFKQAISMDSSDDDDDEDEDEDEGPDADGAELPRRAD